MATPAHSDLAFSLTKHYFGEPGASVIKTLLSYDQASLRTLKSDLPSVKINDLKRSLLILVKYQLVDYVKTVKNFSQQYEYSVVPQRVFAFFRVPKFISGFGSKEGKFATLILTAIAERGLLGKKKLIEITLSKLQQSKLDQTDAEVHISHMVDNLVIRRFLVRTSNNHCINIERFNRDHRDDLVVDTLCEYYNKEGKVKAISRAIINLSLENTSDDASVTAPIPLMDLTNALIPGNFQDKNQLEKYLSKLTMESSNGFFISCGVHPEKGPMYAINVGLVIDHLVREHLSSLIATRFGPKCCRVFKVLLMKGPLLLKQIEEIIMLPARDVREYSYMLIKEGYIKNRQVPKTPDNAPGKSVFIMSVELDQVVYSATDLCCRSINNLLMRYEFELHRNKPLLDRSKAVHKLLESTADNNATQDDWNQYFNSHELSQLERVNRIIDKILLARAQVDETLFLLHSWLKIWPNLEVQDGG